MVTTGHVVHAVGIVVLVALVFPFVVTGAPAVVGAEESYVVLSGSMEPTIKPGDVVITRSADPSAIESGDVITYERASMDAPVTHRVIEVREQEGQLVFQTKGDGNEEPDSYTVTGDQVIGTVWFTLPKVGYVVNFANTTRGFLVLVLVPLGLLALSEAWNFATGGGDDPDGTAAAPPEAGTDPGADEAGVTDSEGDESSPTVTLDEQRLLAALGITGPAALALGYVASQSQAVWAVTGTYLTAGLFLIAGALYVRLRTGDDAAEDGPAPREAAPTDAGANAGHAGGTAAVAPEDRSIRGEVPAAVAERPCVEVADPDRLARMAAADDRWVIEDPDRGARFLVGDEVVYRGPLAEPDGAATEGGEPVDEDTDAPPSDPGETAVPPTDGDGSTDADVDTDAAASTDADVDTDPDSEEGGSTAESHDDVPEPAE